MSKRQHPLGSRYEIAPEEIVAIELRWAESHYDRHRLPIDQAGAHLEAVHGLDNQRIT